MSLKRTKARLPTLAAILAGARGIDIDIKFRGPGGEYSAASCEAFGWRVWDWCRRYRRYPPHEVARCATAEDAIEMARRLAATRAA